MPYDTCLTDLKDRIAMLEEVVALLVAIIKKQNAKI